MLFNIYQQTVIDLFIAAYGRVPTQRGLDFFAQKLENGTMSAKDIANYMFDYNNNPEASLRYPNTLSTEDKINTIFEHVLERPVATKEGLEFWKSKLSDPNYTFADVVLEVINAAKNYSEDAKILNYKSEVAKYFISNVPYNLQSGNQVSTDGITTYNKVLDIESVIDNIKDPYSNINNSYQNVDFDKMLEVKALDSKSEWNKNSVTFSFNETIPSSYNSQDSKDFVPLSNEQKEFIRDTFLKLEDYINIDFQEVSNNGDIKFSNIDTGEWAGYSYYPGLADISGDVFLSNNFIFDKNSYSYSLENNGYGREIIAHEIGHALGLKHPFDGDVTLPLDKDYDIYTVMSYDEKYNNTIKFTLLSDGSINAEYKGMVPDFYTLYDIETLQAKYGVNDSTNKYDNTYSFNFTNTNYYTLWDSGGEDTLDLSTTVGNDYIDLNGGTLNSVDEYSLDQLIRYYQDEANASRYNNWIRDIVTEAYNNDKLYTGKDNLSIVKGTIIENIFTGSGDDTVIDNYVNNIIDTGSGNDKIYIGNGGLDHINGGNGVDYIYVDNTIDNLSISRSNNGYYIQDSINNYAAFVEEVEYIVDSVGIVNNLSTFS